MIKPPSAQWGQCLPSLVWPVSGNPKGSQLPSFPCLLPTHPSTDVSRTVLTYSLRRAMRNGCSSRQKSGWEGRMAAQDLTLRVSLQRLLELSAADQRWQWRVQDKAVESKRTRVMLKELPPVPSVLHPHWLPISSSPVAGSLPPQVLDMEFPLWGPFFSYLATRHHLLVSLWSQPTPHFVSEAFLKDTHPIRVFQKLT